MSDNCIGKNQQGHKFTSSEVNKIIEKLVGELKNLPSKDNKKRSKYTTSSSNKKTMVQNYNRKRPNSQINLAKDLTKSEIQSGRMKEHIRRKVSRTFSLCKIPSVQKHRPRSGKKLKRKLSTVDLCVDRISSESSSGDYNKAREKKVMANPSINSFIADKETSSQEILREETYPRFDYETDESLMQNTSKFAETSRLARFSSRSSNEIEDRCSKDVTPPGLEYFKSQYLKASGSSICVNTSDFTDISSLKSQIPQAPMKSFDSELIPHGSYIPDEEITDEDYRKWLDKQNIKFDRRINYIPHAGTLKSKTCVNLCDRFEHNELMASQEHAQSNARECSTVALEKMRVLTYEFNVLFNGLQFLYVKKLNAKRMSNLLLKFLRLAIFLVAFGTLYNVLDNTLFIEEV